MFRFTFRELLMLMAIVALASSSLAAEQELSRVEFAKQMSLVVVGDSPERVRSLLGKPEEVLKQDRDSTLEVFDVAEIWYYGVAGSNRFPTLGRIYFSRSGQLPSGTLTVREVAGRGPVSPSISEIAEGDTRKILSILGRRNELHFRYYDPGQMIAMVNCLQPLGRQRAIALIEEYLRLCPQDHSFVAEKIMLLLRVLFEPLAGDPPLRLGLPEPDEPKLRAIPTFPLLLVDDVPILVVLGFSRFGTPLSVREDLAYFAEKGRFRKAPLVPTSHPWRIVESLERNAERLPIVRTQSDRGRIQVQIVAMFADSVPAIRNLGERDRSLIERADVWKKVCDELEKMEFVWDDATGRYRERVVK